MPANNKVASYIHAYILHIPQLTLDPPTDCRSTVTSQAVTNPTTALPSRRSVFFALFVREVLGNAS